MTALDTSKVSIKTSLAACFGRNLYEQPGAHEFLQELSQSAQEVNIQQGGYIFKEGDPSDYVFIAISGAIMLERSSPKGARHVFAFLFTGNLLGLSEFTVYSFSAVALTGATVVKINKRLIQNIFERHPKIAKSFHDFTTHVLHYVLDQMYILGQKTAPQRLAHFLLDMDTRLGRSSGQFYLPMNRIDIADYLGMSLETTSRSFSNLKKRKLIEIESSHKIIINDRAAILEFIDE
ncbi:Crp/Fnr family transcriptional regulator [Alkalimonas sp. MEB108]|uniref:Crp/Fnr family transcriptional regulator n=1 Tax=Alkalimonas cellulosilytica TaxID=3058395 RepID=A0ABU7J9E1_9GAMM|nr:Crp/Fnr family transcriptional regulator [Alkalimonas sp. MEB108]MEE2002942.1 Crp/Fnr family transcriptional regulator [Alkalimonas sp. MEB108]